MPDLTEMTVITSQKTRMAIMTAMSLRMTITGKITQAADYMQRSFGKMAITMAKTLTDLMKTGQKAAGIMMLRRKMITVRMSADTAQKMILTTG